ncbi:MAG: single-stranded DNA-binding protein [bacterium]|nr:single-stranded DNA-binding protein [bacterium]
MNLNKVFIIGNLTADPELRQTPGGATVTTVGIATNRVWNDKAGAKQTEVEYHSVVIWGRQAEIVKQYLTKGSSIFIEGRLQTRNWDDKQGVKHWKTEVVCEQMQLGPRPIGSIPKSGGGGFTPRAGAASSKKVAAPQPEEIPVINIEEENSGEIKTEDLPF